MATIEDELRARIMAAFRHVEAPTREQMLQPIYASTDDVGGMMVCYLGKHWTEIPIDDLFQHRDTLFGLSGIGFRAYIPAVLMAALIDDERCADIAGFMFFALRPLSKEEVHVTTTRERLSLLDPAQRAAIAGVLRYLEAKWQNDEAGELALKFEQSPGDAE